MNTVHNFAPVDTTSEIYATKKNADLPLEGDTTTVISAMIVIAWKPIFPTDQNFLKFMKTTSNMSVCMCIISI